MTRSIKSNSAFYGASPLEDLVSAHVSRVQADGGQVDSVDAVRAMIADAIAARLDPQKIMFLGGADTGYKLSASDVVKVYSVMGVGGDLIPVNTAPVIATHNGLNCLELTDAMMRIETAVPARETSLMVKFKATGLYFRRVARFDGTTTLTGLNNQIGSLWAGSVDGYRGYGYSNGSGFETDFAAYEDFKRLTLITRAADNSEFFVAGESGAASGAQEGYLAGNHEVYFKLGGQAADSAVNSVLAFAGVLRPWQMALL